MKTRPFVFIRTNLFKYEENNISWERDLPVTMICSIVDFDSGDLPWKLDMAIPTD